MKKKIKKSGLLTCLFKSEFIYNRTLFMLMFGFTAILSIFYFISPSTKSIFPVLFIPFLIHYQIVVTWSKERRIRYISLLPLGVGKLALARMIMIIIPYFLVYIVFMIIHNLSKHGLYIIHGQLVYILSVIFILYSISFMVRDVLPVSRKKLFKIIGGVVIALLCLSIVSTIIVYYSESSESGENIFSFMSEYNPFSIKYWTLTFFMSSIVLSCITVFTFVRRRSYI